MASDRWHSIRRLRPTSFFLEHQERRAECSGAAQLTNIAPSGSRASTDLFNSNSPDCAVGAFG